MNGKERILAAFAGRPTDVTPVGIDYLRLYLAERIERAYVEAYRPRLEREGRVRLDSDDDVHLRGQAVLRAYSCFQERDDWLLAAGGPSVEALRARELVLENGGVFELDLAAGTRRRLLRSGQEAKTEEMANRYEDAERGARAQEPDADLLAVYWARWRAGRGDVRLARWLAQQVGESLFLYCGAGCPFTTMTDLIGFETTMTGVYDAPERLLRLMDSVLETTIENLQAYKDAGGHGVRIEDCLTSADLISQKTYERFVLPYEERLCAATRRMGLKTILYFCGDVMPRLPYLRQLPIDALMVEESKKDFIIDIAAVRQAVGDELCLLGNVDVYEYVLKAPPAALEAEVERQIHAAGKTGRFIVGVGSPLTLDTPPERADLLVRFARQHRAG